MASATLLSSSALSKNWVTSNIFIERGFLKEVERWLASLERYYWIHAILVTDLCVFFKQITERAGLKRSTDGKRLPQEYVFSDGYASQNVLLWLFFLRTCDNVNIQLNYIAKKTSIVIWIMNACKFYNYKTLTN